MIAGCPIFKHWKIRRSAFGVRDGFKKLEEFLDGLPQEDNNAVLDLCLQYSTHLIHGFFETIAYKEIAGLLEINKNIVILEQIWYAIKHISIYLGRRGHVD